MIEEFWIIQSTGICLFHKSIRSNTVSLKMKPINDTSLFSGLFSAILTMYSELSSSQIQKLEGDEGKFLFFTKHDLIYIVKAGLNASDKKIKKKIEIIQNLFIKKFENELINFDGEISNFSVFEDDLNTIFNKISKSEKWGKNLLDL